MNSVESGSPLLTVVIPARNCKVDLQICLDSLSRSSFRDFEVIVVDDASTTDITSWIEPSVARVLVLPQQSGPATARNIGAQAARGELLMFLDADIGVHSDTLQQVVDVFRNDTTVTAVFGSYDTEPSSQNYLSQYRNLMHHFVHQKARAQATTFWSGCGAIRREVFLDAGGFHPDYRRPCIEDIELGVRLHKAGHRIMLDNRIQVTHRKCWNLWGMLKTDVRDRALPWSQLILQEGKLPNDLNLGFAHRLSAVFAGVLLLIIFAAAWQLPWVLMLPAIAIAGIAGLDNWSQSRRIPTLLRIVAVLGTAAMTGLSIWYFGWLALVPIALVLGIVMLNWPFYSFLARARHPLFAALAVPLQIMYYLYSLGGLAVATALHVLRLGPPRRRPAPVLLSNPVSIYQRTASHSRHFAGTQLASTTT